MFRLATTTIHISDSHLLASVSPVRGLGMPLSGFANPQFSGVCFVAMWNRIVSFKSVNICLVAVTIR